jgi:hypothetical protein
MIVVNMMGGIGNQLFQYAAGRALAVRHHVPLALDLSAYELDRKRTFALESFRIRKRVIGPASLAQFLDPPYRGLRGRIHHLMIEHGWRQIPTVVQEQAGNPAGQLEKVPSHAYLRGYWQSDRCFEAVQESIRREVIPRQKPDERNRWAIEQAERGVTASIHVRRGDYVCEPVTRAYHGLCDIEYYHAAVEYLGRRTNIDRYFVFSDEPDWVRANLRLPAETTIVDWNGGQEHWDVWLMSRCCHHVIANSSFSWWGAWLDPRPDKIVVAPKRWYADPKRVKEGLPPDWVQIG